MFYKWWKWRRVENWFSITTEIGNSMFYIIIEHKISYEVLCTYRVCHRFRLTNQAEFFGVILATFELIRFLEAAGAVLKIGSSLKPNQNREI